HSSDRSLLFSFRKARAESLSLKVINGVLSLSLVCVINHDLLSPRPRLYKSNFKVGVFTSPDNSSFTLLTTSDICLLSVGITWRRLSIVISKLISGDVLPSSF